MSALNMPPHSTTVNPFRFTGVICGACTAICLSSGLKYKVTLIVVLGAGEIFNDASEFSVGVGTTPMK